MATVILQAIIHSSIHVPWANPMSTSVPVVACDCPPLTAVTLLLSVELTFCDPTYRLLAGNFNCEEDYTDSGLLPDICSAHTVLCTVGQSPQGGSKLSPHSRVKAAGEPKGSLWSP